jgi:hypothetical protein
LELYFAWNYILLGIILILFGLIFGLWMFNYCVWFHQLQTQWDSMIPAFFWKCEEFSNQPWFCKHLAVRHSQAQTLRQYVDDFLQFSSCRWGRKLQSASNWCHPGTRLANNCNNSRTDSRVPKGPWQSMASKMQQHLGHNPMQS